MAKNCKKTDNYKHAAHHFIPLLLACCSIAPPNAALDNGLALKPPMGWIAWQRFTCQTDCLRWPNQCISSRLVKSQAQRLIGDGYSAAGYHYVNLDDCWSRLERHPASGRLEPEPSRFPEGMSQLAAYLHSRKLKLGLYGDCGPKTCAGYPGQLVDSAAAGPQQRQEAAHLGASPARPGAARSPLRPTQGAGSAGAGTYEVGSSSYFELDANTLANWSVDSFKLDGCHISPTRAEAICPQMAQALRRAGRPILLTCEWPFYMMYAHAPANYTLAGQSCNLWRYYDDIEDSWQSVLNTIDYTVKHQSTIVKYHGPGHWFDPDQLVIGNFGLSLEQARAQMAIWSLWSAPLFMGNDLRSVEPKFAEILKNGRLIAVDQDALGVLALMVAERKEGKWPIYQAFVKPVEPVRHECPSFVVLYLNRATLGNRAKVSFALRDLLLAAPIHEAAQHQARLLERASPLEREGGLVRPAECLARLAGTNSPGHFTWWRQPEETGANEEKVYYLAQDLISGEQLGAVALDGELELEVAPSGVRMLKLVEFGAVAA